MMQRHGVWFEKPFQVTIREEPLPELAPDQMLVQTLVSAISAGTELLFYRGLVPPDLVVDPTIPSLVGTMRYPLQYGYACVGRVIAIGAQVQAEWYNRYIFSFQPHVSHFLARVDEVLALPSNLEPHHAAFLASMETAVNLVMDGAPILGENVVVLGQGIVGLLTTALLAQFPLAQLIVFDRYALRRERARALGATHTFDPADAPALGRAHPGVLAHGADLTYELSGNPEALNLAIELTGFEGRLVIGSWYGQKRASLELGGKFHRSRLRLISSQVSTLAANFSARWSKARRFEVAWAMLARVPVHSLITHRFPVTEAARAYELLDQHPEQALQVLLEYL